MPSSFELFIIADSRLTLASPQLQYGSGAFASGIGVDAQGNPTGEFVSALPYFTSEGTGVRAFFPGNQPQTYEYMQPGVLVKIRFSHPVNTNGPFRFTWGSDTMIAPPLAHQILSLVDTDL